MREAGTVSIVRRGAVYQVRYASNNPYALDCQPYTCTDEAQLGVLLRQCGVDPWSVRQACTELRKGRCVVLPTVCAVEQMPACFLSGVGDVPGEAG